jgi:GNAT superfamily N-acetyltransferase
LLVTEDEHGRCAGFVSVARHVHFTGLEQAYVGELAVAEGAESIGVGRALLTAAEEWAAQQGFGYVALDTGAHTLRARGFYEHLGYGMESVRLVKVLTKPQSTVLSRTEPGVLEVGEHKDKYDDNQ